MKNHIRGVSYMYICSATNGGYWVLKGLKVFTSRIRLRVNNTVVTPLLSRFYLACVLSY